MRADDIYKDWSPPDVVRDLERELKNTRYKLISLATRSLPDDIRDALIHGYSACKTEHQFSDWQHDTIAKIIAAAEPEPENEFFGGRLAYCPLCNHGAQQWGSKRFYGFALPLGLEKHLTGRGNTSRCDIFATAVTLARDYLQPKFEESKQREHDARETRRQTERLFLIDPTEPAKLIDEKIYFSVSGHRSVEELEWAEARLRTLGFEFDLNGNVMAYRLPHLEFVILADPRQPKKITFRIFERSPPESKPRRRRHYRPRPQASLELHDQWTQDIPAKFKDMLEAACNCLRDQLSKSQGKWRTKADQCTP
jgi:hypothetical protein